VAKIHSFRELRVYEKLRWLHLEVHKLSLTFPKFELYELGGQIRRSSNSAAAQVAEGWGSRHTNIYIERICGAMGEVQETQHHLGVARDKGYLDDVRFAELDDAYDHCGRMLERLHQALSSWKGTTRTGTTVREDSPPYGRPRLPDWQAIEDITQQIMDEFD